MHARDPVSLIPRIPTRAQVHRRPVHRAHARHGVQHQPLPPQRPLQGAGAVWNIEGVRDVRAREAGEDCAIPAQFPRNSARNSRTAPRLLPLRLQAKTLNANKLARFALEKLAQYKVPVAWQEQVDAGRVSD